MTVMLSALRGLRRLCSAPFRPYSTISEKNESDFVKLKNEWWTPKGEFEILSRMNQLRVPFICEGIRGLSTNPQCPPKDLLKSCTIIDVGCGGGLLTEPLGRLGAQVTGLDPVLTNIEAARAHTELEKGLSGNVKYVCDSVENVKENFDALVASEVVEHVDNLDSFIRDCAKITKPRGHLFFTTINRTIASFLIAKVGAEYITNFVPRGLHDWRMFVTPQELQLKLTKYGCALVEVKGMMYHPIGGHWTWTDIEAVNYALHAIKIK